MVEGPEDANGLTLRELASPDPDDRFLASSLVLSRTARDTAAEAVPGPLAVLLGESEALIFAAYDPETASRIRERAREIFLFAERPLIDFPLLWGEDGTLRELP